MTSRPAFALLHPVLLGGTFVGGRASADSRQPPAARGGFENGYRAGREDAFAGFDGGWAYGVPYIVTLQRGGQDTTYYRVARRLALLPGTEYRRCGAGICIRTGTSAAGAS